MEDKRFKETLVGTEVRAWFFFKQIFQNLLGNNQTQEYEEMVQELIKSFQQLASLMSVKMHFLNSHLDYFPDNCQDYGEEQGNKESVFIKTFKSWRLSIIATAMSIWWRIAVGNWIWNASDDQHKRKSKRNFSLN